MIVIGTFEATVTNAEYREFSAKDNPNRVYKVNEVEFWAQGFCGKVREWEPTTEVSKLPKGCKVKVMFDRCNPVKGLSTFFEFSGKVMPI